MAESIDDKDYIIEIYDIPPEFKANDLVDIFREFRNDYFLVRWVDKSTAIGIFDNAEDANNALTGVDHHTVKCRTLEDASHASIKKALTHQKRGRDDQDGARPKQTLRVFYDDENDRTTKEQRPGTHGVPRSDLSNRRGRGQRSFPSGKNRHNDTGDNTNSIRARAERGRGSERGRRTERGRSSDTNRRTSENDPFRSRTRNGPGLNLETEINDDTELPKIEQKRKSYLPFKKVVALSKMDDDPGGLLLEIGNSRSGFKEFLENPKFSNDHLTYILKIMAIVDKSTEMNTRRKVLQTFQDVFLDKLTDILNGITMKTEETRAIWQNNNQLLEICNLCTRVLCTIMTVVRGQLGKYNGQIRVLQEIHEMFDLGETLSEEIKTCKDVLKSLKEETDLMFTVSDAKRKQWKLETDETRPPPNNFREIEILPSLKDLQLDEKPFLRANKCKGKYENLDTYLDVQFRLLREDYMQPLRSGISEYKRHIKQGLSVKKIRDIRLYHSVQILRPVCSRSGINYVIQFDTSQFKSMNWAASRRLLHGSLLCLSCDNFETNIYAIVQERKLEDLRDGFLEVHLEKTEGDSISSSTTFVMAETTAFFEAYRHILAGLQEINESLPFQRYLVNCESTIKPPKYLLGSSPRYDFSCLFEKDTSETVFPVLNDLRWPTPAQLGFDKSQFEALKTAVTKEIAIIQGPPGTGKTYVGLKITRLLLENKHTWSKGSRGCPILVVCYTNHALDQFLEGIMTFCSEGIVRLGGRCKEEALNEFVLSNIKKKRRKEKSRTFKVLQSERDCYTRLNHYEGLISKVSKKLKSSTTEIFPLSTLEIFMTPGQIKAFKVLMKTLDEGSENTCLSHWLGIKPVPEQTRNLENAYLRARQEWELIVLSSVKEMTDIEREQVHNVWKLNIHERARLYKTWISEAKAAIGNAIASSRDNSFIQRQELIELDLNQNIQSVAVLQRLVSSEKSRSQLLMSTTSANIASQDSLYVWLALNGTEDSSALIKEAISIEETVRNYEVGDIEEERELDDDDDDDDFLFSDYGRRTSNEKESMDGNWQVAYSKTKMKNAVKFLLSKAQKIEKEDAHSMTHILDIPHGKRRDLYKYWMDEYRLYLREKITDYEKEFSSVSKELQEVADIETVEILSDSVFMGMTTTGAAKYRSILQKIHPKIVIVEEAAEVLESHIVTALNTDCEHLILIGDHKQLRPSTTVYELAKKYHLDISLFERMVMNQMPCITLSEQHRMRPEISELLRFHSLYPNLQDHRDVMSYPDVKGIEGNFRFICHTEDESRSVESTSYSNPYEANYIAALTRYLLKQGYTSDKITVLTPYMGQVLTLRKQMPKIEFEGVRITAVDNYQGEENDIILLSLVRSSQVESKGMSRNPIGFVGIENRICVALSRAKIGFYVIGNFELFRRHSDMWQYMTRVMVDKNRMSTALTLQCQIHPENFTIIEKPEDFRKVPDGGCQIPCNTHLPCGHICPRACHILDRNHKLYKCLKPCTKKICPLGHLCTKKCFQDCGKCNVFVEKSLPLCGHTEKIPCHMEPLRYFCTKPCQKTLPCGHACPRKCGDCTRDRRCLDNCKVPISKTLKCGHSVDAGCSEDVSKKACQEPCTAILSCSHVCAGNCTKCFSGKIHEICKGACPKTLPCGHRCSFPCSEVCPPCTRKCQWKCSHSLLCKHSCPNECVRCEELCAFRCKHRKCSRACHEDCDVVGCSEPCQISLNCGHKCNGFCGEICFCVTCADDKTKKGLLDMQDESVRYVKLPDCGCIIEATQLDIALKTREFSRTSLCKRCPNDYCQKAITTLIWRYANILKRCRRDITQKNEAIFGNVDTRVSKVKDLIRAIKSLELRGLTENEATVLERTVKQPAARLYVLTTTVERLADILKVRQSMSFKCIAGSTVQSWSASPVHPNSMVALLLTGRKVSTKQFWNDIELETSRMRLYALLKDTSLNNARLQVNLKVPGLISKAEERLTDNKPFSRIRYNAIAELYNMLNDIDRGISASTSQLDALKDQIASAL